MWLAVLPQIIARIHLNNKAVGELLQSLLVRIGKVHPQQLQALDAIFANMNAMRMDFVIEKINPGGSMQLVQRPFGSRQQQGRGGRRPRGGVQLGQRRFGSGQRQGRGGPRGGAHGGRRAADRSPSAH